MPRALVRRGSTYLDVSTTPHTPEGRLKFDPLRARCNIPYKKAICTTLLFICDENRDLGPDNPADTPGLSVSLVDLQTIMRGRAEAADIKLGPCKYTKLRPALLDLALHRHIELTYAENNKSEVQHIYILPSFNDIYKGFQGVLDGCGILSARTRYRAYMSLAANVFGSNRTPTVLQAVKCAVEYSKRCEALERSIARRGEMHGIPNQHDDSISQYSREHRPSMVDAGIQMDEDEFTTPDDVNGTGENEVNQDFSMEPMLSEEPSDIEAGDNSRQIVPVTPIRPLNRNGSSRQIGLPTPESLPRRNVVMTPSPASSSDIIPPGSDDGSHSDNHNPQTPGSHSGYISFGVGAAFGFVQGIFQGFRWSSDILLPEISSLHTQVINLQTSLGAAEQALHDANMTTAQSQERCSGMLQDLENARNKIASLEVRAKDDADEKCDLQQEIANLKGEVLRLQNGIEQVTQIMGALLPARAVV